MIEGPLTIEETLQKFLLNHPSKNIKAEKSVKKLSSKTESESYIEYYTNIIAQCDIVIDSDCGIKNYFYPKSLSSVGLRSDKKFMTRVRDAKKVNDRKAQDSYASWIEGAASQARAVSILLSISKVDTKSKNIIESTIVQNFQNYLIKLTNETSPKEYKKLTSQFSYKLIELLKTSDLILPENAKISILDNKSIAKMMNEVRDFGNFEDEQNHIITLAPTFNTKPLTWASIKVNPISDEIKKEYNLILSAPSPEWFKKLTPVQKALTIKYKKQIIDGEHVIPTQLRFLPGLKNCYQDIKYYGKEASIEMHSGTMAYNAGQDVSDESIRLTKLNIAHAEDIVSKKALSIQVLNSNSSFEKPDQNICTIMLKSVDQNKIEYHQDGINLLAALFTKNLGGVTKTVSDISIRANDIHNNKNKILWTMCKSGKDRTFIMLLRNAAVIFGKNSNDQQIALSLAKSNHADVMAGGVGGTRGALGLIVGAALTGIKFLGMKFRARLSGDKILGGEVKNHWTNDISYINNWEKGIPTDIKSQEKKQPPPLQSVTSNFKGIAAGNDDTLSTKTLHKTQQPVVTSSPNNTPWLSMLVSTIVFTSLFGPIGLIVGPIIGYGFAHGTRALYKNFSNKKANNVATQTNHILTNKENKKSPQLNIKPELESIKQELLTQNEKVNKTTSTQRKSTKKDPTLTGQTLTS